MMGTRSRLRYERGFTLVEMMTIVIIVGVLATLAVYSVRKYILSSKVGEATAMMASVKSAEEAFKGETFIYLDVSGSFDPGSFYPVTTPGAFKTQWGNSSPASFPKWQTLGVHPDGPVAFTYAVVATGPNLAQPAMPTGLTKTGFGMPSTTTGWQYIAIAKADLDGNGGPYTWVVSHSYSSEIYVENEGQ
jgi:prepilin-type N-terminal cleavage/methylation domain-containing protein